MKLETWKFRQIQDEMQKKKKNGTSLKNRMDRGFLYRILHHRQRDQMIKCE